MSERVFHSIEELKAYLKEVPASVFVKITVEVEGDGREESDGGTE